MIRFAIILLLSIPISLQGQQTNDFNIGPEDVDVKDFCITPSGMHVYTAVENTISLYDILSGEQLYSIAYPEVDHIRSITLFSDSSLLISATDKGAIIVHDLYDDSRQEVQICKDQLTEITSYSENNIIAIGTSKGEVILYDLVHGSLESFQIHHKHITDIEFSHDGNILMSSGMDGKIMVTKLSDALTSYCLTNKLSPCRDIAINNKSTELLASFDNGKIYRWDIYSDTTLCLHSKKRQKGWATGVAFHRKEPAWTSCTSKGEITLHHPLLGDLYSRRIKAVATRIEFCYVQEPYLVVLVSKYNGGLQIISATNLNR